MSTVPPWLSDGLPDHLTAAHFLLAAEVMHDGMAKHLGSDRLTGDSVRPVVGDPMVYFRLYGTHYPHNASRLAQQWEHPPLAVTAKGERTYPVILVADPTPTAPGGVVPIGVAGVVGYLGSAYGSAAKDLAARLPRDAARRRSWVTRLLLAPLAGTDWNARVWLPGHPYS